MKPAGWESAREAADRMGERWRTTDVRSVRDFAGGLHANLLANTPGETSGPPSDAAMIILVVRGERHHRQWQGGRSAINGLLPSGRLSIIPAGLAPRAVVTDAIRVLHVHVPTAILDARCSEYWPGAGTVELVDPRLAEDPRLYGPMTLLAGALESDEPPGRLWLDGVGDAICGRVLERWSSLSGSVDLARGSNAARPCDWRVRRAIDYLEARLAEDVGLAEVAAAIGLSTTQLTTLFHAGIGAPPHRWLMRRRFERACELLSDPRRSVTEIAHACGFASSQHLATVFQRRLGVTPSAFRRERLSWRRP